jgi:RNA polymerase sigma factor (sigma-70 family)
MLLKKFVTKKQMHRLALRIQSQMKSKEFIFLLEPFKDKLFRIAKRLLVSHEEAEDATQEVIVKLWKQKDKLNEYKSVEALAVTMTKNYCLDQLKSKRAQNLKIVHSNYRDWNPGIEQKIEEQDNTNWIGKIVATLPETQKLVFQLRDIEGHEFEEIANMLEISETNARVLLSRARKTIKEALIKKHQYGTS